jgi:hypothetical protein
MYMYTQKCAFIIRRSVYAYTEADTTFRIHALNHQEVKTCADTHAHIFGTLSLFKEKNINCYDPQVL